MQRFTFRQAQQLVIESHLEFAEEMLRECGEETEEEIQHELRQIRQNLEAANDMYELVSKIVNSCGMDEATANEGVIAALAEFQ